MLIKMLCVGIDPGLGGGIAAVDETGRVHMAIKMPPTPAKILDVFDMISTALPVHVVIEKVGATPQMGVVSAFTFGKGIGGLHMALTAAKLRFDEVHPLVWQRVMGVLQPRVPGVKRKPGSKDKNINKRRAVELFPAETITHYVADALLLAEYCRRLHTAQ